MIVVLLLCGTNYSKANRHLFYGGTGDSVLISYDDLRIANAKMTELKFTKEINTKLKEVIELDSIRIEKLEFVIEDKEEDIREAKKREKIYNVTTVLSLIGLIISLFK